MYFHFLPLYELECEILVEIPASMLDSTVALRGKEDDIVRKNLSLQFGKNYVKTCQPQKNIFITGN